MDERSSVESPTLSRHFKSVHINMPKQNPFEEKIGVVERMGRLQAIVKHLTMMGYEVETNDWDVDYVRVVLTLNSGKRYTHRLHISEFDKSFVVEKIARELNDQIKNDF